jgi:murein L,D-transpeptidase YcbB/YkuD
MRKRFIPFALLLVCTAASTPPAPEIHWTAEQIRQLHGWLHAAPLEGLAVPAVPGVEEAVASGDAVRIDRAMTAVALALARAHLLGCSSAAVRAGWRIEENDAAIDLSARLRTALAGNDVEGFFAALRPRNSAYHALRAALASETDSGRRATLIRNLERWRWLPLDMGNAYLLVNAASFEVGLWENGQQVGRWRVINGKPKTPTPIFSAVVSGVTINPWWDVPPSIVAESVGRLVRKSPAVARRRGYVWGGGFYRQRPGPGNALGQMKLVMPNPYKVYLHDTPNKALFDEPVRAFSHGCIRVDQAVAFAGRLLGRPIDQEVARGATVTMPLPAPLPVYVAYFTADVSADGAIVFHRDIYDRDTRTGTAHGAVAGCANAESLAKSPL